jgi:hypothetical protein
VDAGSPVVPHYAPTALLAALGALPSDHKNAGP